VWNTSKRFKPDIDVVQSLGRTKWSGQNQNQLHLTRIGIVLGGMVNEEGRPKWKLRGAQQTSEQ
jgi:hypothetical protein